MKMLTPRFGGLLRSLERHLANQAEQREDNAVEAHLATLCAAIDNPAKRRQGRTEPMPYRLHIAIAFALLASALASLYCWYP
jgi:hypothetical protein